MAAALPSTALRIAAATPFATSFSSLQRSRSARRRNLPTCQVRRVPQRYGSLSNPKSHPFQGLGTTSGFSGRTGEARGSSAISAGNGGSRNPASGKDSSKKAAADVYIEDEEVYNEDEEAYSEDEDEEIDEELLAAMLAEEELLAAELEKGGSGSGSGEAGGKRAWSDEEWDEEELDELFDKYGKTLKEDTSGSSAGYKLVREEDDTGDEDEQNDGSEGVINGVVAVGCAVAASRAAEAASAAPRFPPDSDEASEEFAIALAVAASDAKGGDIIALDVRPLVYWTQYFVIATAFSRAQMDAIAKRMRDVAESPRFAREQKGGDRGNSGGGGSGSGRGGSAWTLLDYGDVVVHLFTPKEREYYRLEEFYANAEEVPLPFPQERRY